MESIPKKGEVAGLFRGLVYFSSAGFVYFLIFSLIFLPYVFASEHSWTFDDEDNYTVADGAIIAEGEGLALIDPVDQTDDDNDATYGFGAGSHTDTEWDATNDWLEIVDFDLVTGGVALPDDSDAGGWVDMSDNIALWHFDEASGTEFSDSSANDNTASCTNCPTVVTTGRFSRARNFDGADNDADALLADDAVTTTLSLDQSESTTGATMMAWVYSKGSYRGDMVLTTDNGGHDWTFFINANMWRVWTGCPVPGNQTPLRPSNPPPLDWFWISGSFL